MQTEEDVDSGFLNQANRNLIAMGTGIAALVLYWLMLSPTAFPGTSAHLTSTCLGLEPQLTPGHPLWRSCVFPARFLPAGFAVYALNLWSALCGALSVALLFRVLSRWVQKRIVLDVGLPEHAPQFAALVAGLTGAFAFATSLPLWAASTRLNVITFQMLLLLLAFNLLQDHEDREDRWRPFVLALLCGVGCAESALFLLMTPFFIVMLLYRLYKNKQSSWGRIAGLALTGLVGTTMYAWAASQFAGTEGFILAGYSGRLAVIGRMLLIQLAELRQVLPRSGWVWVLIMVFLPWLAIQFEARNSLNRRREVATMVFHVVLILLVLPVQFNSASLPWSANLPGGRLPVLELLLTAMTLGYLTSFWVLRFMELPEVIEDDDELSCKKRKEAENTQKSLRIMAGAIAAMLVLLITVAAAMNAGLAGGRGGRFVDSYAHTLLDQLKPDSWLVTEGMIDTNLRLAACERGQNIQLINLSAERNPLQIKQLCKVIETDPAFDGETARYINAARLGCAAFLQEWLASDPGAAERVVFYAPPDLLFEAGLTVQVDRLIFLGVKDMEFLRSRPFLEEHRRFWMNMEKLLTGPVKGSSVNFLRAALRRHVSMTANNLGVLLEDLKRPEEAYTVYLRALDFDADNFSAMLNRVVLTRQGVTPLDSEEAELEAAESLKELKRRPDSRNLARFYGYVRVPGEFARQSSTWMRFGQPRMAEAILKRAMNLVPAGEDNPFLQELAVLHLSNNKPDESEAAFLQMLQKSPADPRALLGMVRVSNMRQDHKAAREWLDKAAQVAEMRDIQVSLEQAKIEIAEGSYVQAQKRLQAITDVEPAFLEAWALQANLLLSQNKAEEAERDILPRMKSLSLDTPQYITAVTEAYILQAKGLAFFKPARELFLLAFRLQPGSRQVLSEILKIDLALHDQAASEQHAAALLRLDRDDPLANYVMGSIQTANGDLAGAEEHLRRSAAAEPSTTSCNDLAEVLRMREKLPEAEAVARQALTLNPENAYAHDTLACILLDAGRLPEARQASATALALAPQALPLKITAVRISALNGGDPVEGREMVRQLMLQVEQLSPQQRADLAAASEKFKKR